MRFVNMGENYFVVRTRPPDGAVFSENLLVAGCENDRDNRLHMYTDEGLSTCDNEETATLMAVYGQIPFLYECESVE